MRLATIFLTVYKVLGILTVLIVFLRPQLWAQENKIPMKYLGIEEGLSNNSTTSIFQDSRGFMWFGTFDGVNRYDGYGFKIFRHDMADSLSLPHNYINAIGEDLHNNIWVGTGQGVGIYNQLTSHFRAGMYKPNDGRPVQRIHFNINNIATDYNGNLFIGTNGGGLLVSEGGGIVARQVPCIKDGIGNCGADVKSVVIDQQQRVWVFILHVGLCLYDLATNKTQLVARQLTDVICMEADDQGRLWFGTEAGLYQYNIATREMRLAYSERAGELSSNLVVSLHFDSQKRLLIGTQIGGLNILNTKDGTFSYLLPGGGKNKLSAESVSAICEDRESRLWIGTLKGGINQIDQQNSNFETITHNPLDPNSLPTSFISAFYEDSSRNLWIGTDGGGLSYWNRKQNTFTNYTHVPANNTSISHNSVPSIKEDYLGNIWVATFGEGINKFNKRTGTFEHYPCVNENGEESKLAWLLFEDSQKELWATTYANGRLYRLNRKANRFEVFIKEYADLFSIAEDRAGNLWAGSPFGLVKIDRTGRKFQYFDISKPVRAIYEDSKNRLWLGAEGGGLLLFDRATGKVAQRFSTGYGLCNNAVLNILEDNAGMLWLGTFHGLSKFDPQKKNFTNYYQEDGLQSNQFVYNAALSLRSGELVFGGIRGMSIFYPDSIRTRHYFPPILITGLRVNNAAVAAGSQYVSASANDMVTALRIPFNDAVLSLDFAALEYSAPGKISYAWYLEGWDKGWNYASQRTAYYSRLNEGSYTLRIKSTNAAGAWNTKETILKIIVLPPWYRTWWAYLLYAGLCLFGGFLYMQYRKKQTQLQYQVQIANIEKEKEKELNEKKLNFFTNVSHEFRTPLTLIINPIKDLLYKKNEQSATADLNVVYRNAKRLLSLVDQLLLFRKADSNADMLRVSGINFNDLCNEVYLCFVQQAKTKGLQYSFVADELLIENVYCDREKIEVAIFNLVANAIKYTPDAGSITVTVSSNGASANVLVADSGPGISGLGQEKLYDRFFQANDMGTKAGFGIGLYVSQKFANLHKGSITCESQLGNGAVFTLSIPMGKDHFEKGAVFEDSSGGSVFLQELAEEVIEHDPAHQLLEAYSNFSSPFAEKETGTQDAVLGELAADTPVMLVVDDNVEIRQYISQIFSAQFTLYDAPDGIAGLELARIHMPDIIISDVVMEGGSGIELCMQLKADEGLRHIPIILLSASSSADIKLKGIELGADDYITKPFDKDLLVARVTNLLQKRNSLQQYFFNEVTLQQNPLKISEEYKQFLDRCIAIVEKNIDKDDFNVKSLVAEIGMSQSNLYKKVKAISGQSISSFIRFIRLRKAASLLVNTQCNVNEAAFQAGISDAKYFRKQFQKLFGMNPTDYIKKYRKPFQKQYSLNEKAVK